MKNYGDLGGCYPHPPRFPQFFIRYSASFINCYIILTSIIMIVIMIIPSEAGARSTLAKAIYNLVARAQCVNPERIIASSDGIRHDVIQ